MRRPTPLSIGCCATIVGLAIVAIAAAGNDIPHGWGQVAAIPSTRSTGLIPHASHPAPSSRDAHAAQGDSLWRQGKRDGAAERFLAALKADPNDVTTLVKFGTLRKAQGRLREAVEHYDRALQLAPGLWRVANSLAWIRATHADASLRDGGQALKLAQQACEATGQQQPACFDTLAAASAELGRFDAAIIAQRRAIEVLERQPAMPAGDTAKIVTGYRRRLWLYETGRAFREGADQEEGRDGAYGLRLSLEGRASDVRAYAAWILATHEDARLRDGAAAVELAEAACRDSPAASVEGLDILAAAYAEAGRFPEAIGILQRAVEPTESAAALPTAVELTHRLALYRSGAAYREAPAGAMDAVDDFIKFGSAGASAYVHLLAARRLGAQSRPAESIQELTEAARLVPGCHRAQLALADAHLSRGNDEAARERYLTAISLKENDAETLAKLAALYKRQGQDRQYLKALNDALRQNPELHAVANSMAWTLATHGDEEVRDAEQAVQLAERICRSTDRRQANYLDTLAAAYAEAGRFDEAVQAMGAAIDIASARSLPAEAGATLIGNYRDRLLLYQFRRPFRTDWRMHYELGKRLWDQGRDDEALRHRLLALGIEDQSPEFLVKFATDLRREGHLADCARIYRVVWRQRPDWLDVGNSLAWLLATAPAEEHRDATEAVALAERICESTGYQDPRFVDTLAAAYAEAGRFEDAVIASRKACQLVTATTGASDLAHRRKRTYQGRLQCYQQQVAWRETSPN